MNYAMRLLETELGFLTHNRISFHNDFENLDEVYTEKSQRHRQLLVTVGDNWHPN
jgi:hypothetical protein